ncbi:LysR family transcriptional regulator [Aurantimonas sp. VKM B-3413]|uniref:LysR family transcriptional regulator n=1 Tax=Aurantimonas sp. VKM B-3413 TaxID=2779401 RepID=UPI001E33B8A0|nr:LysR family transcriptional regulator [Aurantimonas sp. VKM B-3413]MCB8838355.1 LysR family transcriptional regulator [Aurantimonas sp. VKM B-3413]
MRVSGSDLRLLQVFDAVVRHGGFAAAAGDLNVSQSTISNHMTALEERLGFVLCHRGRGGFRLTEKGRAAFDAARRLDKALQDFSTDVASVRGELSGELRIGILDAIASDPANHLAAAIAAFGAVAPNVTLAIAQERPQDMQQKVADGLYHCAIGSYRNRIDGIVYDRLYEERHSLYCGRGHEAFAAADAELTDARLATMPFVHRGYWREEDMLRELDWRVEATVHQIEPQLILIQSGRYVGLLPDHYAAQGVAEGTLRAIRPDEIGYTCVFELFSPANRRLSDVTAAFIETVKRVWASPQAR